MLNDMEYNNWRRDIAAEYTMTTGRVFATRNNPNLIRKLVEISDFEFTPSPIETLQILKENNLVKV